MVRKAVIVIAICIVVFMCGTQQAFAASIDGLEVVTTTDQQEYKATDDIVVTITITNRNDVPVTNISLESLVPEGYELKKDGTNVFVIESLLPNETVSFTVTLDSLKADNWFVRIALYVLLGGVVLGGMTLVVIFIVQKKKRAMRTVVAAMIAAVLSGLITPAFATTPQSKMTIVHTVRAGKAEVSLNMLLSYDHVVGNNEFLGMDTAKMLYDMTTDTYYNYAPMPVFSGTLLEADHVASMVCTVTDAQGNLLLEKNILPANFWSVNDFAMIVGVNYVRVAVAYETGETYEKTLTINNVCAENMATLDVDQGDDDEDGVLNFIERMYYTDPQKADTDGDGLSDYDEMAVLGTDPKLVDTDANGVSDAAEDADGDQLFNLDEIILHMTSPICADSDGDNLSDWDEIQIYLTNPNKADTDEDGARDDWELENGYNPLVFDEDLPQDETVVIPDNVEIESEGEVSVILLTDHELINEKTLGYIGQDPIYVQVEEGYSANISMTYDQTQLEEGDEPALYYFDEQTQCYEHIESSIDENGNVVASVDRSGVYVLLNHRLVNDVWENDIFRPGDFVEDGTIDVVFVIDRSHSMYDNDPQELRKLVTKEFISKLRDNVDRAAIVQFTAVAELIMTLSYDKEALCNAVDAIQNSDGGGCDGTDPTPGTNGSAGIRAAINELANSEARYKYIIFLTDGADTEVAEDYGDEAGTTGLTGEAKEKGIVIHTVGLVGTSGVDVELLKRVAKGTGGNYYLATVGENPENSDELIEIYDEIESITIDRHLDSNNDGISDYYTKLICDGKLTTGTGKGNLFGSATYEQVQSSADLDGDGLLNGEELIVIENEHGVFVRVASYPYRTDSDNDTLNDPYEIDVGTNPTQKNGVVDTNDLDWLNNSEYFMADLYLDCYRANAFERGSVFIGNAFWGTTLDQTVLYRQMLIEYFAAIDKNLMSNAQIQNYRSVASAYLDEVFFQITEQVLAAAESGDEEKCATVLTAVHDLVKAVCDNFGLLDKAGLDELVTKLVTLNPTMQMETFEILMTDIREEIARVPGILPAETADLWKKHFTDLTTELNKYQMKAGELSKEIELRSGRIKGFTDSLNKVGDVMMVIGWANNTWEACNTFCEINASLQTVSENIYILECIIDNSDNIYLTAAARDLKLYLNESLSQQTKEFIMAMDQAAGVVTSIALELLYEKVVPELGMPGAIIALVRTFGNVVYDLDDISKAAAETVALSYAADILSINFQDHLSAGHAIRHDDKWIAYRDYSHDLYICLLNLAQLRKMAEEKVSTWQTDSSLLKTSNDNQSRCQQLIEKYNNRYLQFFIADGYLC